MSAPVDPVEAVRRRLRRVDALLRRARARQQQRESIQEKGQHWGTFVTDAEVDELLSESRGGAVSEAPGTAPPPAETEQLGDYGTDRLGVVMRVFALGPEEQDILVLAVAAEVDATYAKVFAFLNDDLARPWLTASLACTLVAPPGAQRRLVPWHLRSDRPLIRHRLVVLDDTGDPTPLRPVRLGPGLLDWLLGGPLGQCDVAVPQESQIHSATSRRLDEVGPTLRDRVTVKIVGGAPGARIGAAGEVARRLGRPLVRLDVEELIQTPTELDVVLRDLQLTEAVPCLVTGHTPDDPAAQRWLDALRRGLDALPGCIVLIGPTHRSLAPLVPVGRPWVSVPVERPAADERRAAWIGAWTRRGWTHVERAGQVADRFHGLAGASIEGVLDQASAQAGQREPDLEHLWSAAREAARPRLGGLAQRIVPRYAWDDLVLPSTVLDQLRHLEHYLAHQEMVLDRWGGRRMRPRGYGLKALFSGAPGTGKTMAAEVLAGSLGLDLYRVDLSSVISRWVGETEKNLRGIFDAAEGGAAVLLFDEADALFGVRGEVKQAQDRFANQAVSYLLQRLEGFEGCAVLTTNLLDNIDPAFLRRFGAVVEFPMPSAAERAALWSRAVPRGAPRADDVDLEMLARQFALTGGSIVNAAIHGCVAAAADQEPVGMRHLVRAIARELVQLGRQVSEVHFGAYYEHVQDMG